MMLEAADHTSGPETTGWCRCWRPSGGLSVAYSFRFIVHVFFGPVRDDYPHKPHDPSFGLWAAPALLAVMVVAIGILPAAIVGPLVAVAGGAVIGDAEMPYYTLKIWHGVTPALIMSLIATFGGIAVLLACFRPLDRAGSPCPGPRPRRSSTRSSGPCA
jgi:multicomponent K+:H+ antiporter subunit A